MWPPSPAAVGEYVTEQEPELSTAHSMESNMPEPVLPQLTVCPETDGPPDTVAVHVALSPTFTESGLHVIDVWVSAGCTVVGLKFAVIVPTPLIVAVVDAKVESATTIDVESLTLQLENAYPELAVAEIEIVAPEAYEELSVGFVEPAPEGLTSNTTRNSFAFVVGWFTVVVVGGWVVVKFSSVVVVDV